MGGDGGTRTSRNRSGVERASAAETLSPRGSPSDLKSADVKEAEQRHATLDCSTGDGRSAAGALLHCYCQDSVRVFSAANWMKFATVSSPKPYFWRFDPF